MKNDACDERGLRAAFARQRAQDHAEAPAWCAEKLATAAAPGGGTSSAAPPRSWAAWLPAPLAAAACAALAALMGWPASPAMPRLSEALPPLFEEAPAGSGAAELFAGLGPVSVSFMSLQSPSDVLLPASLAADPGFN